MSSPYVGNYTAGNYNPTKRYRLNSGGAGYPAAGFVKGVPLSDAELREVVDVADSFARQMVSMNFVSGASLNDGFHIVQSTDPVNNFKIRGNYSGSGGTYYDCGKIVIDGYIVTIKNDMEYKNQNATGALTDDGYTKTTIPALTTPGSNRTDEVYIDFYFAEVSAVAGSEYLDTSLLISGIGSPTANRVRMVRDIRVAEGAIMPSDGFDVNGIYHRYKKIATLNRLSGNANILTAMITDNRVKTGAMMHYSGYNTFLDIGFNFRMSDGQNIGHVDSTAGTQWTTRSGGSTNIWNGVCYGNGLFVAVAVSGSGNRVMTSPDGVNWTLRASAADNAWLSVCYGNGLFVAVSYSGIGNRVMTSPDGITWTSRTSAADNNWLSVCYGNDIFVAVATSGSSNRVMTSPDGITWTIRTSAADNSWLSVCYGNGVFVAISSDGFNTHVMRSQDGINWTLRSTPDRSYMSICYGGGKFVTAVYGTSTYLLVSNDGETWTNVLVTGIGDLNSVQSICYGNGLYVFGTYVGSTGRIITSPDLATFTQRSSNSLIFVSSICFGNGIFVSVDGNNVGSNDNQKIMTSGTFGASVGTTYIDSFNTYNGSVFSDIKFVGTKETSAIIGDSGKLGIMKTNPVAAVDVKGDVHVKDAEKTCRYMGISRSSYFPLARPQVIDLATSDVNLKGFLGGFTDGRYGYFCPYQDSAMSGKVARLDLNDFSTVTVLDFTTISGDLKGYFGGFVDGKYAYFVPYYNGADYHGKIVRVDLQNFVVGGCTVLDLSVTDSDLKGFRGGFTDGTYGYFVPYNTNNSSSKLVRVDLRNFSTVTVLNLASISSDYKGFSRGFTDGKYGYFVPYANTVRHGFFVRVDLNNFTTSGVTVLDLLNTNVFLKSFIGGFTDGVYAYLCPTTYADDFYSGVVARVNLKDFSTVNILELTKIDSGLKGFSGCFSDGKYGYFVPNAISQDVLSGKLARIDLNNFNTTGVSFIDLTLTDASLNGFQGGFYDGKYGYCVPNTETSGITSGKVARILCSNGGTINF